MPEAQKAERVKHIVEAAIAGATVDLDAPGERVRFVPEQLEAVASLYHDAATHERVLEAARTCLEDAVMALSPSSSEPPDWHDSLAALALLDRLEGTVGSAPAAERGSPDGPTGGR